MTPRPLGAWTLWQHEVIAGLRTIDEPMDALYHAAFCESKGLDALDEGRPGAAAMWFTEALTHVQQMGEERVA